MMPMNNKNQMATTKTASPVAPVPISNEKKASLKPKKAVKAPVPVVETPAPVQEPIVEAPVAQETVSETVSFEDALQSIISLQAQRAKLDKEIDQKSKLLTKMYQKDIKDANKNNKRKVPSDPLNPKGITKPVLISEKLATFLGVPHGTKMSRPEVTKKTSAYLNERNLKHPENRTIFDIDAPLKEVLGEPIHLLSKKNPELGYGYCNSNLQTYLSAHFIKETSA